MVSPALRQLMLLAPGGGGLAGDHVRTGAAEHPVCGDRLEVDLRLAGDRIEALGWRAQGCPATLAVAAAATQCLPGARATEAATVLRRTLAGLGDLDAVERHAERLLLSALQRALGSAS